MNKPVVDLKPLIRKVLQEELGDLDARIAKVVQALLEGEAPASSTIMASAPVSLVRSRKKPKDPIKVEADKKAKAEYAKEWRKRKKAEKEKVKEAKAKAVLKTNGNGTPLITMIPSIDEGL